MSAAAGCPDDPIPAFHLVHLAWQRCQWDLAVERARAFFAIKGATTHPGAPAVLWWLVESLAGSGEVGAARALLDVPSGDHLPAFEPLWRWRAAFAVLDWAELASEPSRMPALPHPPVDVSRVNDVFAMIGIKLAVEFDDAT